MESLIGKTIGAYEIIAEVGRGGMAVVYKAYQRALDRYVAIKVLPPQFTFDPEFVRRFAMEAKAAAKLKHPNIVTIYDVGEQNGLHYIVQEFVEGVTLADLIRREGALPPTRAVHIIAQVASALDYAHALGFVHRDVKPSNIMIGANDHATLTDFGIAKAAEGTRVTKSGVMVGTPEYMAPEQIRGQAVDGRVDVYALGVVGYEMLAGRVPFQGDTARVLYGQVHEAPPPLRSLNPRVPPAVEVALGMALAKEPAQRYARAGEFANALTAAVSGAVQPSAPEAPTRYVPPPPAPPRQKTAPPLLPVLAGIAGAVVLLVVVLAIALMARQPKALAPMSTTVASPSPTAVPTAAAIAVPTARPTVAPTATPLVIVVTATPIPTPTATATPPGPQKRLDAVKYDYEGNQLVLAIDVFDLNTGSRSRLHQVAQGQHIASAVWSRDGKRILIAWFEILSRIYSSWWGAHYGGGIQSMMVDGSGKETVAIGGSYQVQVSQWGRRYADGVYFRGAIWSPDQQRIAIWLQDSLGNGCPFLLNRDGTRMTKLPACERDDYPRYWSVDGKWIVAWSERDHRKLYAYEVDGNRRMPLEQLGKIQVYDQRYWPWRVTDTPVCKGASFWECE